MIKRLCRLNVNSKGQSLVEFAILLPFVLAFILAIIQFAIILNGQITVTHAAREAARFGVVSTADSNVVDENGETEWEIEITEKAQNSSTALLLNLDNIGISVDPSRIRGGELTVGVSGKVDIIVPLIDFLIEALTGYSDGFPVSSESIMRIEMVPLI